MIKQVSSATMFKFFATVELLAETKTEIEGIKNIINL